MPRPRAASEACLWLWYPNIASIIVHGSGRHFGLIRVFMAVVLLQSPLTGDVTVRPVYAALNARIEDVGVKCAVPY